MDQPLGTHSEDTLGPVRPADVPRGRRRGWHQGGTKDVHHGHGTAARTADGSPHTRPQCCSEGKQLQDVHVKAQETQSGPAFRYDTGTWVHTGRT